MAYIPTEWQTGDIITAEKLNKAEEGIAARNPLVVTISENTMSATWQEINDAVPNVYVVMEAPPFGAGRSTILSTLGGGSVYKVLVHGIDGGSVEYKTTTADGYPARTSEG